MKSFQSRSLAALFVISGTLAALLSPAAHASQADASLLRFLARISLHCSEQPYGVSRSGNKVFGRLRSHCRLLQVSSERAEFNIDGRLFTVVLKDNAQSDGGDLGDLYIQFDAREDREVLVKNSVLAFGDPVLALLLVAGEQASGVSQVPDASLSL